MQIQKKNVLVFDLDLSLPIIDNSIDLYCGNQVNNVNNFPLLLKEIYRTLKPHGILSLIEWLYDVDSDTNKYLAEQNNICQSLDYFLNYCKEVGFKILNITLERSFKGKGKGDLLPINANDTVYSYIIYLEK